MAKKQVKTIKVTLVKSPIGFEKGQGKIVEAGTNVILVDGENSGEVFEVPYRGYIGSTFKVLQVSKHIEKGFIKIILDFYKTLFKENKTGSAIPHLNKKIFKSLVVGLPPINEQKAIISKVKSVMIVGGGLTSYYLAKKLSNQGLSVKIIEKLYNVF